MQTRPMQINRRGHERFMLRPAYSLVRVRPLDRDEYAFEGHAYDVSETGARFELDQPIDPGTPVALELHMPGLGIPGTPDIGPGRAIYVIGNVVWADEDDVESGPCRMAVAFTRFCRAEDRERLLTQFGTGRYARAA
ncbi:MAG: PilZ domain-containing protein [Planctomycetota bacterium]